MKNIAIFLVTTVIFISCRATLIKPLPVNLVSVPGVAPISIARVAGRAMIFTPTTRPNTQQDSARRKAIFDRTNEMLSKAENTVQRTATHEDQKDALLIKLEQEIQDIKAEKSKGRIETIYRLRADSAMFMNYIKGFISDQKQNLIEKKRDNNELKQSRQFDKLNYFLLITIGLVGLIMNMAILFKKS